MKLITKTLAASCVILLLILISGCGDPYTKPAMHLDPGFQPQSVDVITILPAVDSRFDKKENVNLHNHLNKVVPGLLKGRRYKSNLIKPVEGEPQYTKDDLKSANAEWIKGLGPEDANWVMVLVLEDVVTKLTFGSTGNAEVSGYLFDKKAGTLVWRDKGLGKVGQGGIVGMLMGGSMKTMAIGAAITNLISSVPLPPK